MTYLISYTYNYVDRHLDRKDTLSQRLASISDAPQDLRSNLQYSIDICTWHRVYTRTLRQVEQSRHLGMDNAPDV